MIHDIQDRNLTMTFEQDLTATAIGTYHKQLKGILEETPKGEIDNIIVDFSNVTNTDSLGLNFLVGLALEAKKLGCTFKIKDASEKMLQLFDFVKLSDKFGIEK